MNDQIEMNINELNAGEDYAELLLNLSASRKDWATSVNHPIVKDGKNLTIEEKTVENLNLDQLGAFLGIWNGTSPLTQMNDLIGTTKLNAKSSDGNFVQKDMHIDGPYSLITDTFTIGLFLGKNDVHSLASSVILRAGRSFNPQSSVIFVLQATNRYINVYYQVPNTRDPQESLDWICLFRGDEPQTNNKERLTFQSVAKQTPSGIVQLDVSSLNLQPGEYSIQYNPGHYTNTFSAAQVFTID